MAAKPEVMDMGAVRLFGAIVAANAAEAASVNERIRKIDESRIKGFAKSFLDLYDAIERIPYMMRLAPMQDLLDEYLWRAEQARELLERDEQ